MRCGVDTRSVARDGRPREDRRDFRRLMKNVRGRPVNGQRRRWNTKWGAEDARVRGALPLRRCRRLRSPVLARDKMAKRSGNVRLIVCMQNCRTDRGVCSKARQVRTARLGLAHMALQRGFAANEARGGKRNRSPAFAPRSRPVPRWPKRLPPRPPFARFSHGRTALWASPARIFAHRDGSSSVRSASESGLDLSTV